MGLASSAPVFPAEAVSGFSSSCTCAEVGDGPAEPTPLAETPRLLLQQFRIDRILGEGAFGVTYACCDAQTGEEVAIKVVEVEGTASEAVEEEAKLLRSLLHDNIVRLREVILDTSYVSLVMDMYSGGDLIHGIERHQKDRGRVPCFDAVHISSQMAVAVQYLHWKGIVHRDIKGDNFVMDREDIADPRCRIALSDFGTACKLGPSERLSERAGTRNFWAPEVFANDYGLKVDVWALGVTLFGLLAGSYPFVADEDGVRSAGLREPEGIAAACSDYLRSMLRSDEALRIGSDEAVSHAWHSSAEGA